MLRFLTIFLLLNFYNPAFSSIKEKIISQMKLTDILSFNFIQTIDEKIEKGSCIIKYPTMIHLQNLILICSISHNDTSKKSHSNMLKRL